MEFLFFARSQFILLTETLGRRLPESCKKKFPYQLPFELRKAMNACREFLMKNHQSLSYSLTHTHLDLEQVESLSKYKPKICIHQSPLSCSSPSQSYRHTTSAKQSNITSCFCFSSSLFSIHFFSCFLLASPN